MQCQERISTHLMNDQHLSQSINIYQYFVKSQQQKTPLLSAGCFKIHPRMLPVRRYALSSRIPQSTMPDTVKLIETHCNCFGPGRKLPGYRDYLSSGAFLRKHLARSYPILLTRFHHVSPCFTYPEPGDSMFTLGYIMSQ